MRLPRIRFGLRTFLLLVAACGALISPIVWMQYRARVQRRAVSHFTPLGGKVEYDYHRTDNRTNSVDLRKPNVPEFLLSLFGQDLFCRVVEVSLSFNQNLKNEDLGLLSDLPDLKSLFVCGGTVNGNGLKHLSHLRRLEDVSLGVPLVDEDLRQLAPLKSLTQIYLMGPTPAEYVVRLQGRELIKDDTSFYHSGLSAAAVNELAKELPGCRITY